MPRSLTCIIEAAGVRVTQTRLLGRLLGSLRACAVCGASSPVHTWRPSPAPEIFFAFFNLQYPNRADCCDRTSEGIRGECVYSLTLMLQTPTLQGCRSLRAANPAFPPRLSLSSSEHLPGLHASIMFSNIVQESCTACVQQDRVNASEGSR